MSQRPPHEIKIGQFIVNSEARRDKQEKISVYAIPSGDGGGKYEIAGINDRYHPDAAARLKKLIKDGRQEEAEAEAVEYILKYTDQVRGWHSDPGIQAFLRDTAFNRGPGGAAKILQMAIGGHVKVDGVVGGITRAAANQVTVTIGSRGMLVKLLDARERYERQIAPPVGSRAKFWKGLQNRWKKAFEFAWGLIQK